MKYTKVFLFWLVSITIVALVCALSTGFKLYAGNSKTDSLLTLLKTKIADTTRINTFNALAWELKNIDPDTAIILSTQALTLAERLTPPFFISEKGAGGMRSKLIANSFGCLGVFYSLKGDYLPALKNYYKALEINKKSDDRINTEVTLGNIGLVYWLQDNYPKALSYYFRAMEIDSILGNKSGMARHIGNIGIVYWKQGDYPKALSYYFRALEIDSVLGNKRNTSAHLGNIGNVYYEQGEITKALSYYIRAYEIDSVLGDKRGIASKLSNIGSVYQEQNETTKALSYYNRSLEIDSILGNKNGMARHLSNIGSIYIKQGEYPKAILYCLRALEIDSVLENKTGIAICLGNIGSLYTETKKYKEAELYLKKALALCDSIGFLNCTMQIEKFLTHLYSQTNRYQQAHEHHLAYQAANDSLFNKEKSKEIGREEMKFEMKMAEIKKSAVTAAVALAEKEKIRKRNLFHSSIIILILAILILSVFFSKRLTAKLPDIIFHKKIDKPAVARSLLYITVLLFFEIILVYMDPFTDSVTGGAPILITIINGMIGCGIYPVYNLLEGKLKKSKSQVPSSKPQAPSFKPQILSPKFQDPSPKSQTYTEKTFGDPKSMEEERKNKDEEGSKDNIGKIIPFILVALWFSFSGQNTENRISNFKFQNSKIDSLRRQFEIWNLKSPNLRYGTNETFPRDTTLINILNTLAWELKYNNPDTAIILSTKALAICEQLSPINNQQSKINNLKANSFRNLGVFKRLKGDYPQALKNYINALKIYKKSEDSKGMASTLGSIGIIYWNQGDYPKALSYHFRALEIDSVSGNKSGIATDLGNIGLVYWNQNETDKALSYYFRAFEIDSVLGKKRNISAHLSNIGIIYDEQNDYSKALYYYLRALEIDSVLGNKSNIATHLGNIGIIYKKKCDYPLALSYYSQALRMDSILGNKNGISRHLGNIGTVYAKMMESDTSFEKIALANKAELYLIQALSIDTSIGRLSGAMLRHKSLSDLYALTGRYQNAYRHDTLYSAVKAKLFNEEKSKDLGRVEMKHELNVAEFMRQQEEGKRNRQLQEIVKRRNNFQYSIIVIGIFLLFGIVFFIARFTLPEWLLELSVFMPFLLLFESLLTFADPTIATITSGAILWKLLCNIMLAVIIEPVHNFFEKKLKGRAVRVNRE